MNKDRVDCLFISENFHRSFPQTDGALAARGWIRLSSLFSSFSPFLVQNESLLFEAVDLNHFKSSDYLLVQYVQLILNFVSSLGFVLLFFSRRVLPPNVNINTKVGDSIDQRHV